jgi:hypothetical protein
MSGSATYANTDWFENLVRDHQARAEHGDELSIRTVCVLALINLGWRPGDPLPSITPEDLKIRTN